MTDLEQITLDRDEAVRRRDELRQDAFELTEKIHALNRQEQRLRLDSRQHGNQARSTP